MQTGRKLRGLQPARSEAWGLVRRLSNEKKNYDNITIYYMPTVSIHKEIIYRCVYETHREPEVFCTDTGRTRACGIIYGGR